MAKPARGGLGRGLNSLIGGMSETTTQTERTTNREQVTYDEDIAYFNQSNVSRETSNQDDSGVDNIFNSENPEVIEREVIEIKDSGKKEKLTLEEEIERGLSEMPIELIFPNPDQPRTNFKEEDLEELSQSIKRDGLLQPILVRSMKDGTYQIIAGERRWQASKLAGLKTVPIRIKDVDEDKALELALIENVQRVDLNPIEEAYGYKRLMDRQRMSQADIAQAMSKGRSTVANALRLLELPEDAQQLLFEEKITAGHARAILSVQTKEGREKITNKIVNDHLTVREAESLARLLSNKPADGRSKREPIPPEYKTVAKALKEILNTNVRIKSAKGKNKIEIEFKDEEDLRRVFDELISTVS